MNCLFFDLCTYCLSIFVVELGYKKVLENSEPFGELICVAF